jgi:hypothetical protein
LREKHCEPNIIEEQTTGNGVSRKEYIGSQKGGIHKQSIAIYYKAKN